MKKIFLIFSLPLLTLSSCKKSVGVISSFLYKNNGVTCEKLTLKLDNVFELSRFKSEFCEGDEIFTGKWFRYLPGERVEPKGYVVLQLTQFDNIFFKVSLDNNILEEDKPCGLYSEPRIFTRIK